MSFACWYNQRERVLRDFYVRSGIVRHDNLESMRIYSLSEAQIIGCGTNDAFLLFGQDPGMPEYASTHGIMFQLEQCPIYLPLNVVSGYGELLRLLLERINLSGNYCKAMAGTYYEGPSMSNRFMWSADLSWLLDPLMCPTYVLFLPCDCRMGHNGKEHCQLFKPLPKEDFAGLPMTASQHVKCLLEDLFYELYVCGFRAVNAAGETFSGG